MIAFVAVVVGRKQISELIKGNLLRISQSAHHHFHFSPIRQTAKHRAGTRSVKRHAFLSLQMKAAVANGEIQLSIWSPAQTMQIVAQKTGIHSEA